MGGYGWEKDEVLWVLKVGWAGWIRMGGAETGLFGREKTGMLD